MPDGRRDVRRALQNLEIGRLFVERHEIACDEIGQTRGGGQRRFESGGVAGEDGDRSRAERTQLGVHQPRCGGGGVGRQADRPEQQRGRRLLPLHRRRHTLHGRPERVVVFWVFCGRAVERDAVDVRSDAGGEHASLPLALDRRQTALQDERAGVDRSDLDGGELQQVHVPVDVRRSACLDLTDLVAGDFPAAALGNGSDELAPRFDVTVSGRNASEREHDLDVPTLVHAEQLPQTFERRIRGGRIGERRPVDRQPDDRRHHPGQVGGQRLGIEPPFDGDTAQPRVCGQSARRRQQRERCDGDRETHANGHVDSGDNPSTSPMGAKVAPRRMRSSTTLIFPRFAARAAASNKKRCASFFRAAS